MVEDTLVIKEQPTEDMILAGATIISNPSLCCKTLQKQGSIPDLCVIWDQVTEFEAGIFAREADLLSPMSLRSSSSLRRTDRYRLVERVFRRSTSSLSTLRPPFFRVFPRTPDLRTQARAQGAGDRRLGLSTVATGAGPGQPAL